MTKHPKPADDRAELYRTYIKTSAVGIEVVLSILIGVALGWFIDNYFSSSPWGLIGGVVIGMLAAGRRLYVFAQNYMREEKESKHE